MKFAISLVLASTMLVSVQSDKPSLASFPCGADPKKTLGTCVLKTKDTIPIYYFAPATINNDMFTCTGVLVNKKNPTDPACCLPGTGPAKPPNALGGDATYGPTDPSTMGVVETEYNKNCTAPVAKDRGSS
ncbi:uncharacterized protein PGTG_13411 [Puccinia graminis f. sp. tritici CRL 75-36-700-3]|uniref:Uncharacterized protein n=1 Tax=Puccinia graminis f. sp. tritici (strain CRL 75-36-700-3 / race SCCL) TaxID=418459 RepID=E3KTM8_PUCGT|nr:uncharacterized protein PGTG_13411 [Puccinia graminis f. sp. tritici CRL 75-36-700-3]EFP87625.1 hypothetical protein PGTG_13411 [Puccinia graminis f. sp. tritici CRL 75-36-700-3]